MAQRYNLDKMTQAQIAALPPFIAIREVGRSSFELLTSDDADEVAKIFIDGGFANSQLCDPDYWRSYNDNCKPKLCPIKTLKHVRGGKRKKSYFSKYDLRKMTVCPRKTKDCGEHQSCRRVNGLLAPKNFSCKCRAKADLSGRHDHL